MDGKLNGGAPSYYRLSGEECLRVLKSRRQGLTEAEVRRRLAEFGPNHLEELRRESLTLKYLRQFKDLMIALLIVSSVISFGLGDKRTAIVLLAIVLFNTLIGFLQEFKAEKIMQSLQRLIVPEAKVLRGGKFLQIASPQLVPGDIVIVEAGDSVPADLRLIDESELATNDFALTGESQPSRKFTHALTSDVELGNRHNLVFMGTTVAIGQARGVVVATGMRTELGRIANLSAEAAPGLSPLQKETNHIAARVTQGTVVLCAVLLPIAVHANLSIKDAFLFAIGIASSIIPQGLPAEINTALAGAAGKLAKARALVKKLSAVETLGATSIICTDKTGTLTQNEMTVEQVVIGLKRYDVSGSGYQPEGQITAHASKTPLSAQDLEKFQLFFATGVLASNARVSPPDDQHATWYTIGDPTEGALLSLAAKAGIDAQTFDQAHPELKEFAFDSSRKRMSSIRRFGPSNELSMFVKGAPESVLERCTHIMEPGGRTRRLGPDDRRFILAQHNRLATEAMRNLIYAYRVLPPKTDLKKLTMDEAEQDLTLLGMVSMIDPPRQEVPAAMMAAHQAHIKVSVITGDFALTGKAIAAKAGLTQRAEDLVVVSGEELRRLSDERVIELVTAGGVVFSRVSPEDKLRIVNLVRSSGLVVAVTGDGINDAPALKRADIGVAMGKTGTDVAKESAEIVLLDDSFHTLVGAIAQGRVIFQNIKKGTLSCFTSNAAELVVNLMSLGAAVVLHIPLALSVLEILAIDLIAELFPIAALGSDPADGDLMNEPPRNLREHILNRVNILDLLWCGLLIGGLAFGNYLWFFNRHNVPLHGVLSGSSMHLAATSMTYLTIVLCQLGNILQRRTKDGLFSRYQLYNRWLWGAYALSLFCVLNIIYNPWIAPYFRAGPLGIVDWLYALVAAAIFLAIREFQRITKVRHHTTNPTTVKHQQKTPKRPTIYGLTLINHENNQKFT